MKRAGCFPALFLQYSEAEWVAKEWPFLMEEIGHHQRHPELALSVLYISHTRSIKRRTSNCPSSKETQLTGAHGMVEQTPKTCPSLFIFHFYDNDDDSMTVLSSFHIPACFSPYCVSLYLSRVVLFRFRWFSASVILAVFPLDAKGTDDDSRPADFFSVPSLLLPNFALFRPWGWARTVT